MLDLMYSNFKYVKEEILPTNNDMFIALYHDRLDLFCLHMCPFAHGPKIETGKIWSVFNLFDPEFDHNCCKLYIE